MNYRVEREHDYLLIEMANALQEVGRSDLLRNGLRIEAELGALERAQRRQPFDVELTFENLSVVIETKVDGDEDGRWGGDNGDQEWQTTRIVVRANELGYLQPAREFRFITYGTSEFYVKPIDGEQPSDYRSGPYSAEFEHIGLDDMIELVDSADRVLAGCPARTEWLRLMRVEQKKRNEAPDLLRSFAPFRSQYLEIDGRENDFPRHRLLFCAPELAFPVFYSIAQAWHGSRHAEQFGRVAIYPSGRLSPSVHDSILNFWEMWQADTPIYPGRTREERERLGLYFEINEDFNLNVKTPDEFSEADRARLWHCLDTADWPTFVSGRRREYWQGTWVYYELDCGLLSHANDVERVVEHLAQTLGTAIGAINAADW